MVSVQHAYTTKAWSLKMSTIPGRSESALIVIDVQNGVVANAFKRDEIVGNMRTLVKKARETNVPVVWVQHSDGGLIRDSAQWQIVPELVPNDDEQIVHKNYRSSFEETNLEEILAGENIAHLIVCGAQTNYCVRHTIAAALERGYDVTLVDDAHTTDDELWGKVDVFAEQIIEEQNHVCTEYRLPGRMCNTAATSSVFN